MKTVTYDKSLPANLEIGRNKLMQSGKVSRVDVKLIAICTKGNYKPKLEYKVTTYTR